MTLGLWLEIHPVNFGVILDLSNWSVSKKTVTVTAINKNGSRQVQDVIYLELFCVIFTVSIERDNA